MQRNTKKINQTKKQQKNRDTRRSTQHLCLMKHQLLCLDDKCLWAWTNFERLLVWPKISPNWALNVNDMVAFATLVTFLTPNYIRDKMLQENCWLHFCSVIKIHVWILTGVKLLIDSLQWALRLYNLTFSLQTMPAKILKDDTSWRTTSEQKTYRTKSCP